ncbi:MAG: RNA methyltransferase [Anaerolineaceae bacterium]|nr:RNA methyltransferase [Anaerolineaceae bacterium]
MSYFEIGIYRGKHTENVGTLWRSAYQLGAAGIFTIGSAYKRQPADTAKTLQQIPLRQYATFDEFLAVRPFGAVLVGIEMGGTLLSQFCHPDKALYLLGSEIDGLPPKVLAQCNHVIALEAVRSASYNVAVAGSIVMYHRVFFTAKD